MIAAIYARKSTGQHVADDAKSVTRQITNAKKFAVEKGWIVEDKHIFSDDGISGAETKRLLARTCMIEGAAKKQFDVVIMQAPDRFSRRDGDEAFGELKALARHIDIWFYSKGERFTFGDFKSNVTGILESEFAAEFRRNIARKTHEAMRLRAERGYVTGGKVFGYHNERQSNGFIDRVVHPPEAEVVLDIYERYAKGDGFKEIAHALNAKHVPAPRPQKGRPSGWDPGTIRAVLRRQIYRGIYIWNKTTKRDDQGARHKGRQPKKAKSEWSTVNKPDWRIVPQALADQADSRLKAKRDAYLRDSKGRMLGSPKRHGHNPTRHLLTGMIECGCGATFEVVKGRYCCSARRRKGPSVCSQTTTFDADTVENVFLDALEEVVVSPLFIDRILDHAFAHDPADERVAAQTEHDRLVVEVTNITKGIVAGGDIPALAEALKTRDSRLRELQRYLAQPLVVQDREILKAALELRSADWRQTLRGPHLSQARQVLRHLIDLPIRIHNEPKPAWLAAAKPEGLATGLGYSRVASPARLDRLYFGRPLAA